MSNARRPSSLTEALPSQVHRLQHGDPLVAVPSGRVIGLALGGEMGLVHQGANVA